MFCVRDLRAVLAGAIICWSFADGVAAAQERAEVTEDLGNSYLLARRTTGQGSIIETLLYGGRAIVTEIVVPGPSGAVTPDTTGAAPVARAPDGSASAAGVDTANLPLGAGSGFSGTLLSGEASDRYLILHRTRASGPVTHEIFRDGDRVGSVTEVGSSFGGGRLPGRNSFAFESTGDRFVVHLTQPDGTKIHATSEHGRFSDQAVERATAVVASPPPTALPAPEPQRLAKPQEPADRIMKKELAPQIIPDAPPKAASARHALPKSPSRPAAAQVPVQTASPSLYGGLRSAPAAPTARPKSTVATVNAQLPPAAAARPIAPAARPLRPPASGTSNAQTAR
jgi:hypothetical protein